MRAFFAAIVVMVLAIPVGAQEISFSQLHGWQKDDHLAALNVFQNSCDRLGGSAWRPICNLAKDAGESRESARAFFEMLFQPTLIGQPPALFTGYFEPALNGSKTRTARFQHPLYARPKDLTDGQAYKTRAQIEAGALRGQGLELAWVEDPVDVFFMHIQGSGRIVLPNGQVLRLGYAGDNGYGYTAIGNELVRRGVLKEHQVSAKAIQNFVRADPAMGERLLNLNPSYVFFRHIKNLRPESGPIGAMALSITPHRSIAVDPKFVRLGAPVWVEKAGANPINRLMIAQDTGGAIKGAQRADIFFGTGAQAGEEAGNLRDAGRMVQLWPNDLLPDPSLFAVQDGG